MRLLDTPGANLKDMSVKDPEGDIPGDTPEESKTDLEPEIEAEESEEIKPARGFEIMEESTEDPEKTDKST